MTPDREQIRRDALAEIAASESVSQEDFDAICDDYPRILAELQQAERERDEARVELDASRDWLRRSEAQTTAAEARLAKVPAFVEAVKLALMHLEDDRAISSVRASLAAWEQE